MPYSSEMQLIDELGGGDITIKLACGFFSDISHAQKVFDIYIDQQIVNLHKKGTALESWKAKEVIRSLDEYKDNKDITVSLTEHAIQNEFKGFF